MELTANKEGWKDRIKINPFTGLSLNEKRLFFSITIIKFLFVLIPPIGTTDLERNIFYGENWWKFFFSLYNLTPSEVDINYSVYDPLTNLLSWPLNTYDYPAIHLMFFAIIALFPFVEIVIAKSILVLFDIANFYLIKRHGWDNNTIKIIAYLYYFFNTYFSSIEGQVESITVFFLLLALQLYNLDNKRKYGYIVLGFGFHWKIIQLILLPYFILKDLINEKLKWENILSFSIVFGVIWIIPLIQGDYLFVSQFFTGFVYSELTPWNPFFIGLNKISGILNVVMIMFTCFLAIKDSIPKTKEDNYNFSQLTDYLPLVSLLVFWGFIYKFGNPWGWIYYIPALLTVPETQRNKLSIALLFLLIIGLIEYIFLANIINNIEILFGIQF